MRTKLSCHFIGCIIPLIVVIAVYAIPWDINLGVKYLFVSTAALFTTLLLNELLIRRWKLTRQLFGMKPLKQDHTEQDEEPILHSTPSSTPNAERVTLD